MSAATFTAVAAFQKVLFGKHPVPFFRKVEITFFQGDNLLHNKGLCTVTVLLKNTTFKGNNEMFIVDADALTDMSDAGIHRIIANFRCP